MYKYVNVDHQYVNVDHLAHCMTSKSMAVVGPDAIAVSDVQLRQRLILTPFKMNTQTLNTAGATYPEYLLIVQRPTTRLLFLRPMSRSEIAEVYKM